MATHKSAEKRARQTIKKTAVNKNRRSSVKTSEKSLAKAIASKDIKALPELLKTYASQAAKAASRNVVSKNHVSRKISRFSAKIASLIK